MVELDEDIVESFFYHWNDPTLVALPVVATKSGQLKGDDSSNPPPAVFLHVPEILAKRQWILGDFP